MSNQLSGTVAHAAPKVTGNIDALRKLVDKKFAPVAKPPKTTVVAKKTRFSFKRSDVNGVFAGSFIRKCAMKKPSAEVSTVVNQDGWRVRTLERKGGSQAGSQYHVYSGPDGASYPSLKRAKLAGFVATVS